MALYYAGIPHTIKVIFMGFSERRCAVDRFYREIDSRLRACEISQTRYTYYELSKIADRIDWCWRFRKITRAQMEELADRCSVAFELC